MGNSAVTLFPISRFISPDSSFSEFSGTWKVAWQLTYTIFMNYGHPPLVIIIQQKRMNCCLTPHKPRNTHKTIVETYLGSWYVTLQGRGGRLFAYVYVELFSIY